MMAHAERQCRAAMPFIFHLSHSDLPLMSRHDTHHMKIAFDKVDMISVAFRTMLIHE